MGEVKGAEFGALLRRCRLTAGLTQEALAERARMSVETVSALERGTRRVPHRETVALLADALSLTLADEEELAACGRSGRQRSGYRRVEHNLPSSLSRLIGRDVVVAETAELVVADRLVTLVGSGGVGKTRVALQVAENLVDSFPGGAYLADVGLIDEPARFVGAVAGLLGIHEPDAGAVLAALLASLHRRRLLLLLDNCEHLVHEVALFADAVLRSTAHVHILATSRERLNVPGEHVYRVPSLTLPAHQQGLLAKDALGFGAIALFVERARASNRDFSLSDENAPVVGEICRKLDGIPLAIELAAARIRAMSALELDGQLIERLRLLTGGSPTAPSRHRTMRSTLDWSYNLLAVDERALLRRASVFGGPWDLKAAQAICSGSDLRPTSVFRALSSLVEKSLVASDISGDETWYRLLETTRAYALEKLNESGEASSASARHRDWLRDAQPV